LTVAGFGDFGEARAWYGIVAPAGTPADAIAKLNAALVRALNAPEVQGGVDGGLGPVDN
jgi:tripartite-type tricarboxylate transporter receptor subunit TctC